MKPAASELHIAVAAYEAASDPSKWKWVLRELINRCGASKAALLTPLEGATQRFLWCDIGFDPAIVEMYSNHWVKHDAWVTAADQQRLYAAGTVRIGSSYLPWERLERTAFYNEFAVAAGVKALVSAIVFDEHDSAIAPRTHLSLFREPGQPEFERDDARVLARVQPHLRKALEISWALTKARGLPDAIKKTLEGVPQPIFLLRANGWIEYATPAATSLLRREGLIHVKNGRLMSVAADYRGWAAAVHNVVANGAGAVVPFTHYHGKAVLTGVVRLAPISSNPTYMAVWPVAAVIAAFELHDVTERHAALSQFAKVYFLTPTEVRVLELLAEGHDPNSIADQLHVEISTVRTHLRSLFNKTGMRRQSDLVRLFLRR